MGRGEEAASPSSVRFQPRFDAVEILVAAAGDIDHHEVILRLLRRELEHRNEELARKNEELLSERGRTEVAFTALADILPGTALDDRYRVDEKIGAGGFGVVYRATHLGLGRRVAVKVLRPLPGREMAATLDRFRREGVSACRVDHPNAVLVPRRRHTWAHGLPLKLRFHTSKLYVSAIPPFVIGAVVGILGAVMGVGGGFIMVPAMIYLIGMPTKVVVGTSVFQFLFVTGFTAVMHATQSGTVDVMLALVLLVGGVIGAQIGVNLAARLRAEQLRILLALLVVGVCLKLFADLVLEPDELFSITPS